MSRKANCRDVDRVAGMQVQKKLQRSLTCLRQYMYGAVAGVVRCGSKRDTSADRHHNHHHNHNRTGFISGFVEAFIHFTVFLSFTVLELIILFVTRVLYRAANISTLYLWDLHRRLFLYLQFTLFYRTHIHDPFNIIGKCGSNTNSKEVYILASSHCHGDLDRAAIQYAFGRHQTCNTMSVVVGRFAREVEHCMPLIKRGSNTNITRKNTNCAPGEKRFMNVPKHENPYLDAMVELLCSSRNPLWIAPEGGINETPRLLPLHTGVARIALKCCMKGLDICSGANIVPIFILFESTSSFRSEVYIELGESLHVALNKEERESWAPNVNCAAGRKRVGTIMKSITNRLLPMASICPDMAKRFEELDAKHTPERLLETMNRDECFKLSLSPYMLPITKKMKKKDLGMFPITHSWWFARMVDMCFMFEYANANGGLRGCSWAKRVARLRNASIYLTDAMNTTDDETLQKLQNVFSLFQSFDADYFRLTGRAAFTAPSGIWWGCGQHMKMHLRLNSPKRCQAYIGHGGTESNLQIAYRRSKVVLRNFAANMREWKTMVVEMDPCDNALLQKTRASYNELSKASVDFSMSLSTGLLGCPKVRVGQHF